MRAKRDLVGPWVIPVLILVCLVSIPAQAKYSGGSGTAQDPYQIATAADLLALGDSPDDHGKHFLLTSDIDLDPNLPGGKVFGKAPIALDRSAQAFFQGSSFAGVFDGNGHTVSHLTIAGEDYLGLFGQLEYAAKVMNLGVVDANISGSGSYIGGLVGRNSGALSQCYSTGAVSGDRYVGGLVGSNMGTVTQSYSTGTASGHYQIDYYDGVGGLVGSNMGIVTQSYSTAGVSGTGWAAGGLVGFNYGGSVAQCYSTGEVRGTSRNTGGLVGLGSPASDSFWDIQTSGQTVSAAGKGRTTEQMKRASNYGGWNACGQSVWTIEEGRDYPHLAWEGKPDTAVLPSSLADSLSGKGTPTDPYLIENPEQFNLIGLYPCDWDKCFLLKTDIDLSGHRAGEHNIIGLSSNHAFRGIFDGNGHKLHNYRGYSALFGYVVGATAEVKNLGLIKPDVLGADAGSLLVAYLEDGTVSHCDVQDCNFSNQSVSPTGTGGLVRSNYGTIVDCHIGGQVSGGRHGVGGLVGYNYGTITYCSFSGSLWGTNGPNATTGGLVGSNHGGISFCYSTGLVSGDRSGGLVGSNGGVISNCYSTSNVSGSSYSFGPAASYATAGLVCLNSGIVSNCYSTGTTSDLGLIWGHGGLVSGLAGGNRSGTTGCFWDTQTSGQATSDGGTGKTTAQMQTAKTFLDAGWDFVGETANGTDDIWWILEGNDYPRFPWEQGPARGYCPSDGAVDVIPPAVLHWGPGGRGMLHDVYLGEDEAAVASATPASPGIYRGRQPAEMVTYEPGDLAWRKIYYWRIDEVNQTDPNRVWKGEVWRFTTADFYVVTIVDDFESYTDDYHADKIIWQTWISGVDNGTGSWVGNFDAPYAEQQIVHGGRQSMPMEYDNTVDPWYSEAQRTWETPQDWTIYGADTLTLYFRGEAGNNQDRLYVAIEDSAGRIAVVAHPDPNAMLGTQWQKWQIPLADLRAAGVDPAAVNTLAIGVGDRKNPKPGGTGKIYIDDICLTRRVP